MSPVAVHFGRVPWTLLAAWAGLLPLGWIGITRSQQLAGGGSHLRLQITWSLIAFLALLLASLANYRAVGRAAYLLFAAIVVLLVSVYFSPTVHGTHRWLRAAGFSVQPSEFAKVAYVLALARWLMYRDTYRRFRGLLVPLVLTLLPVLLILREPDLGTSLVFLPLLFVMLFAAGAAARLGLVGRLRAALFAGSVEPDEPRTTFARYHAVSPKPAGRETDRRWLPLAPG